LLVAERYPGLKANANFQTRQAQLEGTENRISVERGNFNTTVQASNTAVRAFPTNLFAGMLGFHPRPFFNAQPSAEEPVAPAWKRKVERRPHSPLASRSAKRRRKGAIGG